MPLSNQKIIQLAREVVSDPDLKPAYVGLPRRFEPHLWVVELAQRAYALGVEEEHFEAAPEPLMLPAPLERPDFEAAILDAVGGHMLPDESAVETVRRLVAQVGKLIHLMDSPPTGPEIDALALLHRAFLNQDVRKAITGAFRLKYQRSDYHHAEDDYSLARQALAKVLDALGAE